MADLSLEFVWKGWKNCRKDCDPSSSKDMTLHIFSAQFCASISAFFSFFSRVSVQRDLWEFCLTSAWLSTDLDSFLFEMGSHPWVNNNHRPIANAGKIFANVGQILVSLWNVKSELALSFTPTFRTKLICSFSRWVQYLWHTACYSKMYLVYRMVVGREWSLFLCREICRLWDLWQEKSWIKKKLPL